MMIEVHPQETEDLHHGIMTHTEIVEDQVVHLQADLMDQIVEDQVVLPLVEVALHQVEMDLPQEGLAALVLQERLQIFQDHQEVLLGDLQVQGDHPLGKIEVGTEKALVLEVEDLLHLIAEDRLLKEQGLEAHQEEVDLHSDVKFYKLLKVSHYVKSFMSTLISSGQKIVWTVTILCFYVHL